MDYVKTKVGIWREKLQPGFFDLARLWREATERWIQVENRCQAGLATLAASALPESRSKIVGQRANELRDLQEWCDQRLQAIHAKYPSLAEPPLAYAWVQQARLGLLDKAKQEVGFLEFLHFERHGEALQETQIQAAEGDLGAFHKLQRTREDAFRVQHGKGPIKKFQGDPFHRDLLEIGLCFGMEKLTSEELADCFEEYCPCGRAHDSDSLKKQRRRLIQELSRINKEKDATRSGNRSLDK